MKTTVEMTREIAGIEFPQRTSDGYFDANALLSKWNDKGSKRRRMSEFFKSPKTKDFIKEIEKNQRRETDDADFQAVIEQKGRNTKQGKTKDKVWMHPYLFIDFAMYINPTFKYKVIEFVYDQLIRQRNLAGDGYIKLSSAMNNKFTMDKNKYKKIGQALNFIVFGEHRQELRQHASQAQLNEMNNIQTEFAFAIDRGFIKSFEDLIIELRKIWNEKHNPVGKLLNKRSR